VIAGTSTSAPKAARPKTPKEAPTRVVIDELLTAWGLCRKRGTTGRPLTANGESALH
jgi:hypothetical protein